MYPAFTVYRENLPGRDTCIQNIRDHIDFTRLFNYPSVFRDRIHINIVIMLL